MALALMAMFSTASAECLDFALDLTDSTNEGCDAYEGRTGLCGSYDTDLFYAKVWCCACGGGLRFDELEVQPALERPQRTNPRLMSKAKKDERRKHDEEKAVTGHQMQEKDQLEGESHHLSSDCLKVEKVLEYVAIIYPSLVELEEVEIVETLHTISVRYIEKHLGGHRRVLSQKDEKRRGLWYDGCEDSDLYYGWTDNYGDGCDWYYGNEEWCGYYDDGDFWADFDCCACGGGMHNYWGW